VGQGGEVVGVMKLMYNISLTGIVIMNPLLYNEYIIKKNPGTLEIPLPQ
jgi:hypothetical protein